jgi:hypothetical protein
LALMNFTSRAKDDEIGTSMHMFNSSNEKPLPQSVSPHLTVSSFASPEALALSSMEPVVEGAVIELNATAARG